MLRFKSQLLTSHRLREPLLEPDHEDVNDRPSLSHRPSVTRVVESLSMTETYFRVSVKCIFLVGILQNASLPL